MPLLANVVSGLEEAKWDGMLAVYTFVEGKGLHKEKCWVVVAWGGAPGRLCGALLGDSDSVGEVGQLGRTLGEGARADLGVGRLWIGS